jgi:DNA-directed RNA polymerase subunit RPC12/RpoP
MTNYSMKVVPKSMISSVAIITSGPKEKVPLINNQGDGEGDNYLCGACENIICKNVARGQLVNTTVQCPNCGSYNIVKGT